MKTLDGTLGAIYGPDLHVEGWGLFYKDENGRELYEEIKHGDHLFILSDDGSTMIWHGEVRRDSVIIGKKQEFFGIQCEWLPRKINLRLWKLIFIDAPKRNRKARGILCTARF